MNKITETAPERIWLQVSDDVTDLECEFPAFERVAYITWCAESVVEAEVAYVRADLLEAANARLAELERLNLSFATNEQELAQYRNEKNWTRPFDMDGKLMDEHALYLPKVTK